MNLVFLKYPPYEVCFAPERGMNFISFKKEGLEILDQSTQELFEQRNAGLGAMIGPHFHHRNPQVVGIEHYSHGIGRYVPWKVELQESTKIEASLNGNESWQGQTLAAIEGQNFKMQYKAEVTKEGLIIQLSCVSEAASVVGLHTYYALDNNEGQVIARVQEKYRDGEELKEMGWHYGKDKTLLFDLKEQADFGFFPFPGPFGGTICLKTKSHQVNISYESPNQEHSWQLWRPLEKSFVCIEPLSAKNPRKPMLTVNRLKIVISIP